MEKINTLRYFIRIRSNATPAIVKYIFLQLDPEEFPVIDPGASPFERCMVWGKISDREVFRDQHSIEINLN